MKQIKQPTPKQVKQWRLDHRLTQVRAAEIAHCSRRTWQNYETGETDCPIATWELLLLKTGKRKLKKIPDLA